jgi:hypothetical protein
LGYFVLNNAPNNNTTLAELRKHIGFEPKEKRLRYIGHILNLIAEAYLFDINVSDFQKKYKDTGPSAQQKL